MSKLELLTAAEAAGVLRMNTQVVLRKLQSGEIEAYKLGKEWRIEERCLREWLESHSNRTHADPAKRVERTFFDREGRLKSIPTQRTRRLAVLERLIQEFEPARIYTEREVNEVLRRFHEDVCTLRREFVMNKLMVRKDGRYRRCSGGYSA